MFHRCKDKDDAKILFRRLAKHLHPDCGGETDLMIILQECYEMYLNPKEKKESQTESPKKENVRPDLKYQQTEYNVDSDEIEKLKILNEIFEYAKYHPKYNLYYLESVEEYLAEHGYVTSAQYNALVKAYYAFRMDQPYEKVMKETPKPEKKTKKKPKRKNT